MLVARERLVDTLMLARRKHPDGPNRLDDLCARYGIDNSRRTKHGALLDAELLAEVYIELIGARQAQLGLIETVGGFASAGGHDIVIRVRSVPLTPRVTEADVAAHLHSSPRSATSRSGGTTSPRDDGFQCSACVAAAAAHPAKAGIHNPCRWSRLRGRRAEFP